MTDPKPPTHERGPPHGNLALQFDAQEFAHFLDESDLTHEQKLEYIRTVWSIVLQFIDLGFGIHPLQIALGQQACGQFDAADVLCGVGDSDALESPHPELCTDFESVGGCLCLKRIPHLHGGDTQ
jgi:hypothetical protein